MKDIRISSVMNVRHAIFKTFDDLTKLNKQTSAIDISQWKSSEKLNECFKKLYNVDNSDNDFVDTIAKVTFPIYKDKELPSDIYVYAVSICDIIMNPKFPDIKCSRKYLEKRITLFKVFN